MYCSRCGQPIVKGKSGLKTSSIIILLLILSCCISGILITTYLISKQNKLIAFQDKVLSFKQKIYENSFGDNKVYQKLLEDSVQAINNRDTANMQEIGQEICVAKLQIEKMSKEVRTLDQQIEVYKSEFYSNQYGETQRNEMLALYLEYIELRQAVNIDGMQGVMNKIQGVLNEVEKNMDTEEQGVLKCSVDRKNEKKQKAHEEVTNAYEKFLKSININEYKEDTSENVDPNFIEVSFAMLDIDNDKVEELLVNIIRRNQYDGLSTLN